MDEFQKYNKALVVVVSALLVPFLRKFGVQVDDTLVQSIVLLVLAGVVYMVPNKK